MIDGAWVVLLVVGLDGAEDDSVVDDEIDTSSDGGDWVVEELDGLEDVVASGEDVSIDDGDEISTSSDGVDDGRTSVELDVVVGSGEDVSFVGDETAASSVVDEGSSFAVVVE